MSEFTPPRGAEFFAAAIVADPELRDAVVGDLSEDYARIAQTRSTASANVWYWSQLFRSAIPFSTMAVARGGWRGWGRLALAMLAGYGVNAGLVASTWLLLYNALGGAQHTARWTLVSVLARILYAVAAGFTAAVIGGRSPLASALALAVMFTAQTAFVATQAVSGSGVFRHVGKISPWPWIVWLSIILPAVAIGAMLRARSLVQRPTAP